VLGLGLKFLPNTQLDITSIRDTLTHSLEKFILRIRTNINYKDRPFTPSNIPSILATTKYNFTTPIDEYLSNYRNTTIEKIKTQSFLHNLTQTDQLIRNNLIKLSLNNNIVIKPADKNLGTCVITIEIYTSMCYNILLDSKTYTKQINFDTTFNSTYQYLHNILCKYKLHLNVYKRDSRGDIAPSETYLYKSLMQLKGSKLLKIANFYALPKMHKVTKLQPIPLGRPIISSVNSCTYFASKYLHNYLLKLTNKFHTICRSNLEVLYKISKLQLPIGSQILCADVKSLYPSIPIPYGIRAVKMMLENFNFPDISFHIELLSWVLTNNYFSFNNDIYLQIYGTAMGTPVAVEYANIVMYSIEYSLVDKYNPTLYLRYIDDLFVILPTKIICEEFIKLFNNQCEDIQLKSITIDIIGIF
jgi:hypothetical protein